MNPRKNNAFLRIAPLSLAAVVVVSFAGTSRSSAASAAWNGTVDNIWANAANWSASPVPGAAAGQTATFNNQGGDPDTIDLGAGVTIKSILFDTDAVTPYTIGAGAVGSQTLTLETSGTITMNSAAVSSQLFNSSVNLGITGGTESVTVTNNKAANSNTITLAGNVSTVQTGTKILAAAGTGGTVISGTISNGSGVVTVSKSGTGLLTLSGSNTYTGPTSITAGALLAASNTPFGTGSVTLGTPTVLGTGQIQLARGVNVANPLEIGAIGVTQQSQLFVPNGSAGYSGTIKLSGNPNAGGTFGAPNGILTIVGDNTITTNALTAVGTPVPVVPQIRNGIVRYAGAQSYANGTGTNGGTIQFGKITSMPASGAVSVNNTSGIALNVGGTGEFTIASTATAGSVGGVLSGIGGQGAPVTYVSGSVFGIDTTNAATTQTFNTAFGNKATPANALGLVKLGAGTLELNAGGLYNGTGNAGAVLTVREGTLLLSGGIHTVTGEAVIGSVFARANGTGTTSGDPGTNARLQVDGGSLAVSGNLSIGKGNGAGAVSSDLVINNAATLTVAGNYIGSNNVFAWNYPVSTTVLNNTASLVVNGAASNFNLGDSPLSTHTVTVNGAAKITATTTTGQTRIGNSGAGTLNINDTATVALGASTLTNASSVYVGFRSGSGTLNVNGGTLTTAAPLWIGGVDAGNLATDNVVGTFNMTAGTATVNALATSRGGGSNSLCSGTINLSGGILNCTNDAVVGYSGNNTLGKMVVSGTGVFNLGPAASKALFVGQYDTAKGELDVSGGTVNLKNNSFIRMNANSTTGPNVINQTGGAVTFYSDAGTVVGGTGNLDLQNFETAGVTSYSNTYNLDGGTLTVPKIISSKTSGTRTFNFNGGTLKAAGADAVLMDLGTGVGAAHANIRNNNAIVDTNGLNVSIAQPLEHSNVPGDNATDGGLLKQGAGTLTLTGASTYNGPTNVSAGTLNLTGTLASNIIVGSGATATGPGSTTGSLTTNAGSLLTVPVDGLPLQVNGVNFSGATKLAFSGTPNSGQQYVLLNYGAGGVTNLSNLTSTFRSTIVNDAAHTQLLGTLTVGSLNWNTTNGNWAIGAGGWNGSFTTYFDGDDVAFGQRGAASTVTLTGPVSPASVSVSNTTSAYTFTGPGSINGTAVLTKDGPGALTISTTNTYSGGTNLNSGTLNINSPSALGTGPLTIEGGTINNTSGTPVVMTNNILQSWNADIVFTGTSNLDLGTGAVSIGGFDPARTVTVAAGTLAVGKIVSFGQDLVKQGPGKLEASGTGLTTNGSVINGVLNVAAGELQINRTGATAATAGDFTAAGIIGSGTISNGATLGRTIYSNPVVGNTFTFAGTLANGGTAGLGINMSGGGTQILTGTNTYTDITTVSQGGELIIRGANTGAGTNVELQNGKLTLNNPQALGTNSFINLTGNNNLAMLNLATDTDSGTNAYSFKASTGNVGTIISDRATPGAGINHTLTTLTSNGLGGATLNFISGPNVTSGSGHVTFTQLALGAGSAQTTRLNPTSAGVTVGDVFKPSPSNNVSQTLDLSGSTVDNVVTGIISNGSALLGTNNVSLVKSGGGTWTLTGSSTYTGTTSVNEGTLVVSGNNSAANGPVSVAAGAILGGNGNLGGSVNISAGGTQALTVATTAGAQVTRTISGSLTLNFGDTLALTAPSQPANGTYTLVTATGGINTAPTTVTYSGITGATVSLVGNSLVMTIGAASDFSTWISGFTFAPGSDTTATGDPDHDGLTNQQEYAFGLIPNSGSSVNPIKSLLNKATGQFIYTRRKPSLTGLNYTYQFTTDLAVWNDFTPTTTVSDNADPIEAITVTAPAAVTNNGKVFIRVKAR